MQLNSYVNITTMEIPKHPLTHNQSVFLSRLRTFMNEPIYFYGSILRGDYIQGLSDIDVLMLSLIHISEPTRPY